MSILTKIDISTSFLPFEEAIRNNPSFEVKFKPVIPIGNKIIPYMWISYDCIDDIKTYFENEKLNGLEKYEVIDVLESRVLVKAEWNKDSYIFLKLISEFEVIVLDMKVKKENWKITLQFLDQNYLSNFYKTCINKGINLNIESSKKLMDLDEFLSPELSEKQLDALKLAYKNGYFDVPRKTNAKDLSNKLNISDSAFSQRIRRGIKNILENKIIKE